MEREQISCGLLVSYKYVSLSKQEETRRESRAGEVEKDQSRRRKLEEGEQLKA